MIRFHDPRGESAVEALPYTLGTELAADTPVAFLANGFPDSEPFLALVAEVLRERHQIDDRHWNKGNASITVPRDMLGEISSSCQAVVAAYGH